MVGMPELRYKIETVCDKSGDLLAVMLKNLADSQIVYGDRSLRVMCLELGICPTIAIAPWRLVEFVL